MELAQNCAIIKNSTSFKTRLNIFKAVFKKTLYIFVNEIGIYWSLHIAISTTELLQHYDKNIVIWILVQGS